MSDLSMAPMSVQNLAEWLADRGNPLVPQTFDSPTNQLLQARAQHGVQVLADRGQWFVELAPPGVDEFFDTAVWSSCITGATVSLELTPLAEQIAWIEEFLSDDSRRDYSVDCLRETRRKRAFERMGIQS